MSDEWIADPELAKKFAGKSDQDLHREILQGSAKEKAAAQAEIRRRDHKRQDDVLVTTLKVARGSMWAAIAGAVAAIVLAILTAIQLFRASC